MYRINKQAFFMAVTVFAIKGVSQEKSKKEVKAEKKLEQQKRIEELVDSKTFVFVARTALPSGGRAINLTTNPNYVNFYPELIDGNMPFFGRYFAGGGYGDTPGLTFKEKPEVFSVVKKKKNFQINAKVKGESDRYQLSLVVGFEGSSSLTITSNKRAAIRYQGTISALENKTRN